MGTLKELQETIDEEKVNSLIGKTAIACLYQFYQNEPVKRSQDFGGIIGTENGFIVISVNGKPTYLPYHEKVIISAPRGKYILDSNGKEIVNPDYLISWRLDLEDDQPQSKWTPNCAPHFHSIVGVEWEFEPAHDPDFLSEFIERNAGDYIGKLCIVGIRNFKINENDEEIFISQIQIAGSIIRVDYSEGVVIEKRDGTELTLPPDLTMIQFAPEGDYKLSSTGEIIKNPDFITMWTSTS